MERLFLKLFHMGITAGILVIAVILLRLLLRKAPKWIHVLLWSFVAVRLICPFVIESAFSIIPNAEIVSEEIAVSEMPSLDGAAEVSKQSVDTSIAATAASESPDHPLQAALPVVSRIWFVGVLAMVMYLFFSVWKVRCQIREAARIEENIWEGDNIVTPFLFGIVKPQIYLPSSLEEMDKALVIRHEKAHIRRLDYVWKPLGFMILAVYWYNPLLWLAYILFCRDIEFACDEKVIREQGEDIKKSYSEPLLHCSVLQKRIEVCPLAFGEVGVKKRIKNVLHYRKTSLWIVIIAVLVCAAAAVCLLTNPLSKKGQTVAGDDFTVEMELPDGMEIGEFDVGLCYNGGALIGDAVYELYEDEAIVSKNWYYDGFFAVFDNADWELFEWDGDDLVGHEWTGDNHTGEEMVQSSLDGLALPAYMLRVQHDLYTAASEQSMIDQGIDTSQMDVTSEYWYIILGDKENNRGYCLALCTKSFTMEEAVQVAETVNFQ